MIARAATAASSLGEALLRPLGSVWRSQGQGATLRESGHRPWPLPQRAWLMAQTWEDLMFAHWPVAPERLRPFVPAAIPLDVHDGSAWIGVTPFRVSAFRLRGMPHLPGLTAFPELNVRTYTTIGGKPGIWFLSLDAASGLAVQGARRSYRLPYFRARMQVERTGGEIRYASTRTSPDGPKAELRARYHPSGPLFEARPGSLEHFLAERYCLYTLDDRGRVLRGDIHHPPWPLQTAEGELELNTMARPFELDLPGDQALLHFAGRQDMVAWRLVDASRE